MDQLVLIEDDGPVRSITLNRPERLNSFTAASYRYLADALRSADDEPDVHVVVLRGAGRAFSSGVDLALVPDPGSDASELSSTFVDLIGALGSFQKPLLAAVHGYAVGFGATILLHCDIVFVANDARLRFPFTALGTAPEAGSSHLLPTLIGSQRASDLLFSSRWFDGAEAVRLGVAHSGCDPATLMEETLTLARDIAGQPVEAVKAAKRLLRDGRPQAVNAALAREQAESGELRAQLGPLGYR